jgi:Flp pilus assembly pilin Flp
VNGPRRPGAGAAGQGFVEFGVILALAVLVAVAVLVLLRPQLAWVLSMIGSEVDKSGRLWAGLAFA